MKKLFIVKKYVWAENAKQAIQKERSIQVDDIWVDDDWKKESGNPKNEVGFYSNKK